MGYFNAEVTTEIDSIGPHKAEIAYRKHRPSVLFGLNFSSSSIKSN